MFKNHLCLGVIGNVLNHLNQANEAKDFVDLNTSDYAPKGVFPFYYKDAKSSHLKRYCISFDELILDGDFVQLEPELCVVFKASYEGDLLSDLKPLYFAAFNDASKRVNESKISLKKNFSTASKGIGNLIKLNDLDDIKDYKISANLKRDDKLYEYAKSEYVKDYFYYSKTLIDWLINTINNQSDIATLESIKELILNKPEEILISLGALSYTEFGEKCFLKSGDEIFIEVSNGVVSSKLHQLVK